MKMLETAQESCDSSTTILDISQSFLDDMPSPLEKLQNFSTNIEGTSKIASNLFSTVNGFWKLATILAKVAIGPLAPLKGIVTGMKHPMKLLLKALEKGKKRIKNVNDRAKKT